MQKNDIEGACGRMTWWRVLAFGPLYPVLQHASALREAPKTQHRWIIGELAANTVWIALVFASGRTAFQYHLAVTALAQCLTAFFAVWTTHHDCDPEGLYARTQRGRLKNWLSYNMFYHLEHHLFPQVPVSRMGELAHRVDAIGARIGVKPSHVF